MALEFGFEVRYDFFITLFYSIVILQLSEFLFPLFLFRSQNWSSDWFLILHGKFILNHPVSKFNFLLVTFIQISIFPLLVTLSSFLFSSIWNFFFISFLSIVLRLTLTNRTCTAPYKIGCVCYIPLARMVNTTNAKTKNYLGLQNLVFRCFVPSRCQKGKGEQSTIIYCYYLLFWFRCGFCLYCIKKRERISVSMSLIYYYYFTPYSLNTPLPPLPYVIYVSFHPLPSVLPSFFPSLNVLLSPLFQVIYVDADQVLRADLKELWDMDLEGKPYAYTPFCTSRSVWKQQICSFNFIR